MTDEQKIVISSSEERNFDKQIRPNLFEDFIGQKEIVKSLKTYITAAKQREEALDHILLYEYGIILMYWHIIILLCYYVIL